MGTRVINLVLAELGAIGGGGAFGSGLVEENTATKLLMVVGGIVSVIGSLVAGALAAAGSGTAVVRRVFAGIAIAGAVCAIIGAVRAEFGRSTIPLAIVGVLALIV